MSARARRIVLVLVGVAALLFGGMLGYLPLARFAGQWTPLDGVLAVPFQFYDLWPPILGWVCIAVVALRRVMAGRCWWLLVLTGLGWSWTALGTRMWLGIHGP